MIRIQKQKEEHLEINRWKTYRTYGRRIFIANNPFIHYICYVKDDITNDWYEANDESFKRVDSVFNKTTSVCLLCYLRSDLIKSITTDTIQVQYKSGIKHVLHV